MTKRSHRHALPIIVLGVGFFLVSLAGMSALMPADRTSSGINTLLRERPFSIKLTTHGLVEVTRYQSADAGRAGQATVGNIEFAGQSTAAHALGQ